MIEKDMLEIFTYDRMGKKKQNTKHYGNYPRFV